MRWTREPSLGGTAPVGLSSALVRRLGGRQTTASTGSPAAPLPLAPAGAPASAGGAPPPSGRPGPIIKERAIAVPKVEPAPSVLGMSGCTQSKGPNCVRGALISADSLGLSWRLVFLVNVPIGLLAFLMGL